MKRGRNFWKWLILWARAGVIDEIRKKRIMRENLAAWNRENRAFLKKCEREDNAKIDAMCNGESSNNRHYGCDYFDGSN